MARAEERLRGDKNTFRKLSSSLNIFNKLMAKVPFASRRSSIGEGLGDYCCCGGGGGGGGTGGGVGPWADVDIVLLLLLTVMAAAAAMAGTPSPL